MLSITCKNIIPQFANFNETILLEKSQVIIVQIKATDFLEQVSSIQFYLTKSEEQIIAKYKKSTDRNLKSISKFILKQILSKLYQLPIEEIIIQKNEQSKPFCKLNNKPSIYFNVADTEDTIVMAFSFESVGVDIEKIDKGFVYNDIANAHFSIEEQTDLENSDNKQQYFYSIWTRKEAIVKADGAGLVNSLSALSVADGNNNILENPISLEGNWQIHSADLNNSISFSLAFNDQITQLSFFNYLTLLI